MITVVIKWVTFILAFIYLRGELLRQMGRPEEAEPAARRALALAREAKKKEDEVECLLSLGQILLALKRQDEAKEILREARQLAQEREYLDHFQKVEAKTMTSIFISYSRKDKPFVDRLEKHLRLAGFDIWLDRFDLKAGESFPPQIAKAIARCEYFVVVLSPNAIESNWVCWETEWAIGRELADGRPVVIPVLLASCELPATLSDKHCADFREDYATGLIQLLNRLWESAKESDMASQGIVEMLRPQFDDVEIERILGAEGQVSGKLILIEPTFRGGRIGTIAGATAGGTGTSTGEDIN